MAVTRSTAAERRQREAIGAASGLPGMRRPQRNREAILLAGAFAAVLLGLLLSYLAMTKPLAGTVAGMVTNQKTARPMMPATIARRTSLRSIRHSLFPG